MAMRYHAASVTEPKMYLSIAQSVRDELLYRDVPASTKDLRKLQHFYRRYNPYSVHIL